MWLAIKRVAARHQGALLVAASVLFSLGALGAWTLSKPAPRVFTQGDIDAAVQFTLAHSPRAPADSARAAAMIRSAVVAVEGFLSREHARALAAASEKAAGRKHTEIPDPHGRTERNPVPEGAAPGLPDKPLESDADKQEQPDAIGSGVVVKEDGTILTALHVVSSTDRWVIVFADGSRSDATIVGSQPENDLAVLRASRVPDEQQAAILTNTARLRPGDTVVATGFPFGIGPSVSSGVVSGLKREFTDPRSKRKFTNLIQFDAAVNPGNSGGPLVDRDGQVVGIVTALLNPTEAAVFAGIGFAVPIENAARALGDNPM